MRSEGLARFLDPLGAPAPSRNVDARARFSIVGCGTSLPGHSVDNTQLARELQVNEDWIIGRSGVRRRFCADESETTASLAVAAARQALDRTPGFVPDLLLCATFTPERLLCPTAPEVAARLGLGNIGAFDINGACAGAAVGLLTAIGYLNAGLATRVLLVCSDTVTKFLAPDDRGTRILMSDGAAAMALRADTEGASRLLASTMGSAGDHAGAFAVGRGGSLSPFDIKGGSAGTRVSMDGPALFRFGVDRVPRILGDLCDEASIETQDVDWVVMHQANLRMIHAMQKRLNVPPERWLLNMESMGNTVSASIPFLIAQHMQAGTFAPGDIVAIIGFGAGLTWAGVLCSW